MAELSLTGAMRFAALVLLTSCASPGQSASPTPPPVEAPVAQRGLTITVPADVAGFEMSSRENYDDRAAGVRLRYVHPDSLLADVFVYPGPDLRARCAIDCARTLLEAEIATFRETFPEMIQRGYVQTIEVVSDKPLVPPAGAVWQLGRHLRLIVRRGEEPQRSDFYLFYLPGYRVKIRCTFDGSPARLHELETFAAELVPALVSGDRRAPADSARRPPGQPD